MSDKTVCICIHGHFYQPPRENAWIEAVERQESAYPFHDWNERIQFECYLPNSIARVFDSHAQIVNIANNFEKISFNVGPTLMSWLEQKHPETYQRIIEADKLSVQEHHGHGNAIAQVYNHMIMPLADRRDKTTQVRWGIDEFRYRYGRDPEGMWLPETACNDETMEVLVEHGIKFTVLSPYQAKMVRPFNGHWHGVGSGQIDPRQPYRYFLKHDRTRYIDLFFYDGPISRSIGFENLLSDAKFFIERIEGAIVDYNGRPQLIHVATDGETYGHHKIFGDQVLAYLLNVACPERNYRIVNYGEFLAENTPNYEVELIEAEKEGTSWSCAHGVKRWKEHCGCRGDGPGHWNQHWRKPLRDSLDWLRDQVTELFERETDSLFYDVGKARDHYIHIILERSESRLWNFFSQHARRPLEPPEVITCLKLLEMQRHAMLMYASCGWFFTELSGIETVQILQYAARAIQLAKETTGVSLEEEFLERMSHAKSNVEIFKDGRGVYEQLVKPSIASLEHIVSYFAIGSIFEDYYPQEKQLDIHCFKINVIHRREETFENLTINFGRVQIASKVTLEEKDMIFVVIQIGLYDFRCSVKPYTSEEEFRIFERSLFEKISQDHGDVLVLLKEIDARFGESYFMLKDLLLEDRMKIISLLTKGQIEKVSRFYEQIYDENRRMNTIYRSINLPIPVEFRYAAEHVLSKRLAEIVSKLAEQGFPLKKATPAYRIIETAQIFHVNIQKESTAQLLSDELTRRILEFVNQPRPDLIRECLNIHKLSKKMGIDVDRRQAQNHLFSLLKGWHENPASIPGLILQNADLLVQLMRELQLAVDSFKRLTAEKVS
ncbi:MAG: DUF3536 domain-containing protein [Candidatus Omnitrophica bacterium]|nr:DUF3536 domain-containing protein [Candidatus Omnitrophota bacterium]